MTRARLGERLLGGAVRRVGGAALAPSCLHGLTKLCQFGFHVSMVRGQVVDDLLAHRATLALVQRRGQRNRRDKTFRLLQRGPGDAQRLLGLLVDAGGLLLHFLGGSEAGGERDQLVVAGKCVDERSPFAEPDAPRRSAVSTLA